MSNQDVSYSSHLGYHASSWRSQGIPDYDLYAPASVQYTHTPYTPGDLDPAEGYDFQRDLKSLYGRVFWQAFFDTLFPSLTTEEFLKETSTGTPGGYYLQLYEIAARDFYDSFFRGRDDQLNTSPSAGISTSSSFPGEPTSYDLWSAIEGRDLIDLQSFPELANPVQYLIIKKYLLSRGRVCDQFYENEQGLFINRAYTETLLINRLGLRTTNVFLYVASLMVDIMEAVQTNTINAAQYATRLAQTQQAIALEMSDNKYAYQELSSAEDYATMAANDNNGHTLENLRMRRDLLQKETDQASTFLETSQQAVEDQANKALTFLKKSNSAAQLFFRSF